MGMYSHYIATKRKVHIPQFTLGVVVWGYWTLSAAMGMRAFILSRIRLLSVSDASVAVSVEIRTISYYVFCSRKVEHMLVLSPRGSKASCKLTYFPCFPLTWNLIGGFWGACSGDLL